MHTYVQVQARAHENTHAKRLTTQTNTKEHENGCRVILEEAARSRNQRGTQGSEEGKQQIKLEGGEGERNCKAMKAI